MTFDWQAIAAPAIVVLAAAYLFQKFVVKWFRKPKPGASSGCGSCGSCPSSGSKNVAEPEVFQIGPMLSGGSLPATPSLSTLPTVTKK